MIREVIKEWNNAIEMQFDDANKQIAGLAMPIVVQEESSQLSYPALVSEDGESNYVFADDNYKLGVYHRLLSKSYQTVPGKGYGDDEAVLMTADMMLVCWGWLSLEYPERVEQMLYSVSPSSATIVGVNFDRQSVFSAEFKGIPFFLPQEVFLFSIKYKIQARVKKRCL